MIEFFNYLNSIHPLSAEATAALMKVIRMKELRKGQVWLQEGAVCDKMTFVVKGLMKLYFDVGSKEVVLNLAREDEFIVSGQSYFNQVSSSYSIRTVEQSVISYVFRSELLSLLEKFPELNIHLIAIAQAQVSKLEEHAGLLMLTGKERFLMVKKSIPWLADRSRLTDKLLAGYLGVGADAICDWRK